MLLVDENKCERENDIVQDAYFLISLFNKDRREVTQLQVQKIMYFFEAFYMCVKDKEKLYDCNFNAWAFGPVSIPLYQALKKFGDSNIVLDEEQLSFSEGISSDKKNMLTYIYTVFGDVPAMQLVHLTHRKDSPWYSKWKENNEKVVYGNKSYISKQQTKEWFKEVFLSGKKQE